jgi:Ni/Co efflux regulator RcnB
MKKTLSFALALTLLAGTGTAFAQDYNNNGRNDHNRNAPPVTSQQRYNDRDRDNNQRFDDHDTRTTTSMRGSSMAMHGPRYPDWRQGGHIARNDWGRGVHVDYRARHLRTPPRGYEWRQVDGNLVLAAAATGLIASIILNSH